MLAIPLREQGRRANRVHLADLLLTDLADNPIAIADHATHALPGRVRRAAARSTARRDETRSVAAEAVAGRICPASYSYSPSSFARPPELRAEVLYVVGGLYGNRFALAEIEQWRRAKQLDTQIVFNGDYHWFDADADAFAHIDNAVARHAALRGNVETELAGDDDANGCGCAYPETVPDDDVERSNAILTGCARPRVRADTLEPGAARAAGRAADAPGGGSRRRPHRHRARRCAGRWQAGALRTIRCTTPSASLR